MVLSIYFTVFFVFYFSPSLSSSHRSSSRVLQTYTTPDNVSHPCPANCNSCIYDATMINSVNCTECSSSFYFNTIGGYCARNCLSGQGYNLTSDQCFNCTSPNCTLCMMNSDNITDKCQQCASSFYYNPFASAALECDSCGPACQNCNFDTSSNNSICTGCLAGFTVNSSNNSCVSCSPHCQNCYISNMELVCSQCIESYTINTSDSKGNCISCSSGCKTCSYDNSTNATYCVKCYPWLIHNGSFCYPNCNSTTLYYSINNSTCYPCPSSCISCQTNFNPLISNEYQCLECPVSYAMDPDTDSCVPCPSGCQSCYFSNKTMVCSSCSQGYTSDSNMNCRSCSTGCQNCYYNSYSNTTLCNNCYPWFNYINRFCYANCNSTTLYYSISRSSCYPCPSSCLSCNTNLNPSILNEYQCQCASGYASDPNIVGGCIPQCSYSYYFDANQTFCVICPVNCSTCFLNSTTKLPQCYKDSCNYAYVYDITFNICVKGCGESTSSLSSLYYSQITHSCMP